jgi:hypothetical protein
VSETKIADEKQGRIAVDVTFSNGHTATSAGKWGRQTSFTSTEHYEATRDARSNAATAAATTGLAIVNVQVFVEKRVIERFERRYDSRELYEIQRGFR